MLPDQQTLLSLLSYDSQTGLLFWKEREVSQFQTVRAASTWNARYAGAEAFTAVDRKGYRVGAILGTNYRASRVIFKMLYDIDANQVDHEDGNRQNNRKDNLRNVTGQQNQRNMKKPVTNTSGHIGVSWDAPRNKWQAKIKVDGKTVHLGRFSDIDDAVAARKTAEQKYNFHPNHGR